MKYIKIIRDGLKYSMENGLGTGKVELFLSGYFKREAQKAKDQYFEIDEFFGGLKTVIDKIKHSLDYQVFVYKRVDEISGKMINDDQYLKTHWDDLNFMQSLYRDDGFVWSDDEYEPNYDWVKDVMKDPHLKIGWVMNNIEKERYEVELLENAISTAENELSGNQNETENNTAEKSTKPPQPFTCTFISDEQSLLFAGLSNGGFLPQTTIYSHFCHVFGGTAIPDNEKPFEPLQWVKTNKLTHGKSLNKKSLLDLLCILGVPDKEIQNKPLLNSVFAFPNGTKLHAKHYTDVTDKGKNLKKPIVSQYHDELSNIVSKSKEKQTIASD